MKRYESVYLSMTPASMDILSAIMGHHGYTCRSKMIRRLLEAEAVRLGESGLLAAADAEAAAARDHRSRVAREARCRTLKTKSSM